MTQDQVFVPKTRSQLGLPPLDPVREDAYGASVTEEVKRELWEALGDSPIGATLNAAAQLVSCFARNSTASPWSPERSLFAKIDEMNYCRYLAGRFISPRTLLDRNRIPLTQIVRSIPSALVKYITKFVPIRLHSWRTPVQAT